MSQSHNAKEFMRRRKMWIALGNTIPIQKLESKTEDCGPTFNGLPIFGFDKKRECQAIAEQRLAEIFDWTDFKDEVRQNCLFQLKEAIYAKGCVIFRFKYETLITTLEPVEKK